MRTKALSIACALLLGLGAAMALAASQQCFPEVMCRITAPPVAQAIAAGQTIVANACGTVKNVTATGAVATSTTDTFDAPDAGNAGCIMVVCNQSVNTITLDNNARFGGSGAADVALTEGDCVIVAQTGVQWRQVAAVLSTN